MKENTSIVRMRELMDRLIPAGEAYYKFDAPIMTDRQYDELYDELAALEKETGVILAGSPTQKVQGMLLESLAEVRHSSPMLSANKTKSIDDLVKFMDGRELLVSWKEDGLTLVLRYENGRLEQAITRGGGESGEDVTESAKNIRNLPLRIPYPESLEVRGECLIFWETFEKLKEEALEAGEEIGHPRNVAGGAIRQLDTSKAREKNLMFKAFEVTRCGRDFRLLSDTLDFLTENGFDTVERRVIHKPEEIRECIEEGFLPESYAYPVDGLIFAFNDIAYGKSLGGTSHHPLSIMAFKWQDELYGTPFRGIEYNTTKMGIISMTAIFDPVEIDHTKVSRALIPNLAYFKKFRLGEGDILKVYKANRIIPQIDHNETMSGTYPLPETCPCCGHKLERTIGKDGEEQFLLCPNGECPARNVQLFKAFAGKKGFDIDGLSEKTLEKLVERGMVKSFADIFRLDRHRDEIIQMDGFGGKAWEKLWNSIQESRKIKLEHLIAAAGIPNVGRHAGKAISKKLHGDLAAFDQAITDGFDFSVIDGIGDVLGRSIADWFGKNKEVWNDLCGEIEIVPEDASAAENPFLGKTVVVTGTLEGYTRDGIKEKLESLGAKASGSVSKRTDYVLAGKEAGSKLEKARELGVKVLSQAEFEMMLQAKA